jgi:catechol 2,3-dioxygenase-like lactoylglutathione lyase family enzyme
MPSPFRTLHHICIVVHDIDKSVEYYESIGIGPFVEYPALSEYTENLLLPNPDAFAKLRYMEADLENFQLQLCQPPQLDCPQRRFLDEKGEGVFHLGFEYDVEDAVAEAGALGVRPLMRGQRVDGSGFVYFDTADRAAVILETRKSRA